MNDTPDLTGPTSAMDRAEALDRICEQHDADRAEIARLRLEVANRYTRRHVLILILAVLAFLADLALFAAAVVTAL